MPPDVPSLAETLRLRRFAALQSDAELTRDYPESGERTGEGQRLIREAMYLQSLGRISLAERDRIISTLSFAVEAMRVLPDAQDGESPFPHDATAR